MGCVKVMLPVRRPVSSSLDSRKGCAASPIEIIYMDDRNGGYRFQDADFL